VQKPSVIPAVFAFLTALFAGAPQLIAGMWRIKACMRRGFLLCYWRLFLH
jgi:hypothetical protein